MEETGVTSMFESEISVAHGFKRYVLPGDCCSRGRGGARAVVGVGSLFSFRGSSTGSKGQLTCAIIDVKELFSPPYPATFV